jgi:hypothetical protein
MWSGPRNISTAMMRAWGQRSDTMVWDEPLYPFWLNRTGAAHPGRDTVLEAHRGDLDPADLMARLKSSPDDASIFYQKHMSHHLSDEVSGDWLVHARHAFLVRRPDRVLASLAKRYPNATLNDTGLPQQMLLLDRFDALGLPAPPVIDADDVLAAPEVMLGLLCEALQVPRDVGMTTWPAGGRDSDGAWSPWWYDRVNESTGFGSPGTELPEVPAVQQPVLRECQLLYDQLCEFRLRP